MKMHTCSFIKASSPPFVEEKDESENELDENGDRFIISFNMWS